MASYVDVEEAITLLSALPQSPGIASWLDMSETEQEQSLYAATKVLDCLNWAGHKCTCEQELQWPRLIRTGCCYTKCEEIPQDIKLATAFLAAYMGAEGGFTSIPSGGGGTTTAAALEPFDQVTVGPIQVKMRQGMTYGDDFSSNIGSIPAFVADLLRNYLNAFGAGQGTLVRDSIAKACGHYIGSPAYSGTMILRNGKVYPRIGGWASNPRC